MSYSTNHALSWEILYDEGEPSFLYLTIDGEATIFVSVTKDSPVLKLLDNGKREQDGTR